MQRSIRRVEDTVTAVPAVSDKKRAPAKAGNSSPRDMSAIPEGTVVWPVI
ncbi:MAG: hypothetical protein HQK61_02515 [Desulfamplus sp.]|nr:hypothetical protein [Desulfamplus sp.]